MSDCIIVEVIATRYGHSTSAKYIEKEFVRIWDLTINTYRHNNALKRVHIHRPVHAEKLLHHFNLNLIPSHEALAAYLEFQVFLHALGTTLGLSP